MPALPTGTVTFMFTDVEGSTRLLDELGPEGYASALASHRAVIRSACAAHDGVEVDTQGDAFFVAFATATGALAAAGAISEGLASGPIKVRIGIHTGAPTLADGGYVGQDVHLGARIAAAGYGGQVLVSDATRKLVDGELVDLGEHRLKDFAQTVAIYQLGSERFPPLRTVSNTNLPRPASSFVGRETEVAEVGALLSDGTRLVTLTGPGGSGKTRLAIEAAASLVPSFKSGVFWVDLAPLRDPVLVTETIGQTLGAKDGLADHIGEREMLLLVDNLEQVIAAAGELAALIEACPKLRLLVTSRERLRVRGEREYPVSPLAETDAITLFCERSGLEPSDEIASLCRALDELPLAIELAAARASILSPVQIAERLSSRLDLLKGGRDADPRQATLRATIEWSHGLLAPEEQRLFARLAVFAGGCTLEAAEEVCDADLDTLQSLVDKSLLRHVDGRFAMLETIREYAAERLEASGEPDDLRRRHADFFLALAEEAEPHLRGTEPKAWLERLAPESDNFRAALDRLFAWADGESGLRLAGSLDEFWCARAEWSEGRRYLESALRIGDRPTPARARALVAAAHMSRDDGHPVAGELLAHDGLALSRKLGDEWAMGRAALVLGACIADQGDFERARPIFADAAQVSAEAGDQMNALFADRLRAWMLYELGDRAGARTLHEANLIRARELGSRELETGILGALSEYAVDDGRVADALSLAATAIRVGLDVGDRHGLATELCRAANSLLVAGDVVAAVQCMASALAWHEEIETRPLPYLQELIDRTLATSRERIGEETFAGAWDAGRKLSVEDAAVQALEALKRSEAMTKGDTHEA